MLNLRTFDRKFIPVKFKDYYLWTKSPTNPGILYYLIDDELITVQYADDRVVTSKMETYRSRLAFEESLPGPVIQVAPLVPLFCFCDQFSTHVILRNTYFYTASEEVRVDYDNNLAYSSEKIAYNIDSKPWSWRSMNIYNYKVDRIMGFHTFESLFEWLVPNMGMPEVVYYFNSEGVANLNEPHPFAPVFFM